MCKSFLDSLWDRSDGLRKSYARTQFNPIVSETVFRLDAAQALLPWWEIWSLECLLRRYVCGRLRVAAESSVEGAAAGW